jgi:hypothetical protein
MLHQLTIDSDQKVIIFELAITVQPITQAKPANADGVVYRAGSLQEPNNTAICLHTVFRKTVDGYR